MDIKSFIAPISKAIAGAIVGVVIAVLAQYNIQLGDDTKSAIELLINGGLAAIIGFVAVYFAPRNKGVK